MTNKLYSYIQKMGQHTSKLSIPAILRKKLISKNSVVSSPEPPIKFQYSKTRRKHFKYIIKRTDSQQKQSSTPTKDDHHRLKKPFDVQPKNVVKNAKVKYITNDEKLENNTINRKSTPRSVKKQINEQKFNNNNNNLKLNSGSVQSEHFNNNVISNKNVCVFYDNDYIVAKSVGDPKYLSSSDQITKENKNLYTDPGKLLQVNNNNTCKVIAKESFPLKKRTLSEPMLAASSLLDNQKYKRRTTHTQGRNEQKTPSTFGYDIDDIDTFLAKACLKKPANIPVVLSYPSKLYQTQYDGYQDEIPLPLGMVVNAVFKKESWLYVQTPHGEEGYVSYSACLPLGIIPQDENSKVSPCWETSTDLFPHPCGNMTDSEKITQSEYGGTKTKKRIQRASLSVCGERSVDRLYLKAAANSKVRDKRQTLLVIDTDYAGRRKNTIRVSAGDVVALISSPAKGWFWIRTRDGDEGFIPASIAGHGYL